MIKVINVIDGLDFSLKSRVFTDKTIKDSKNKELTIPVMFLHPTDIYVFMEIDSLDESAYKKSLLDRLYSIQRVMKQPAHYFDVYGCYNDEVWVHVNTKNNRCEVIDDIERYLSDCLVERIDIFTEERLDDIYNEVEFLTNTDDKIKVDKNGITYVKRNNKWFEASEDNPEAWFYLTLLLGWLGIHKFRKGQTKQGLLYLFTFGLFGFGWLLDILRILLGVDKGADDLYLLPLDNVKIKWVMFIIAIPVAFLLIFGYYKLILFVSSSISLITNEILGSVSVSDGSESIFSGLVE